LKKMSMSSAARFSPARMQRCCRSSLQAFAPSGASDVLVVAGGIIPEADRPELEQAGISGIFGPGTTIAEVATFLRANARRR
jgi:methylmalonyl-CoA mutase cobalamin-binding domain/chain